MKEKSQSELEFERKRLVETISFAEVQLEKARKRNEENESAIVSAQQEMRENSSHAAGDLSSSDGFEALAAMNQYMSAISEKIASHENTERTIVQLENLIKSPYFARIDFKFADEDLCEKVYIGRSSLMDESTYDMYVYDWRSPIASLFYRFSLGEAYYDAPVGRISGEVNLKRQYEIKKGELQYFFDADVQIVDEFLRKLLSQNTSSKMKAVVETIQKEQDVVIRDMENELMMVQGVAGSGKTSIALHRAAYLMYQGLSSKLSAGNILIISPNSVFEQYISKVLPELGEENVTSLIFEEILAKLLKNERIQSKNQLLENLLTGPRYRDIIKKSVEFKTSPQFMEILNRFISDIPARWIGFEDVRYKRKPVVSKGALKDKVMTLAERKDAELAWALEYLQEFVIEQVREAKGNDVNRAEMFRIRSQVQSFTRLEIKELYKNLLADRDYFYSLAEGVSLPDEIEEILKFGEENLNSGQLYYDDAIAVAYMTLKVKAVNEYKHIKQVVIDEAQDYYPLQYEMFKMLFPNAKYTVLGDINQTLEKRENLSLYRQISGILDKKKSSLVTMDKSFRCTNEILNFAAGFIDHDLEVKSFNRSGEEPEIYVAEDESSLDEMIINEVEACRKQGYQSVGLICKTEKNGKELHNRLKSRMDVKLINSQGKADLEGVFIIPVYMSKGLEFDAVLICDADLENYSSEDDKNLLYICCTRALHRLNLFCRGKASPLVK